MRVHASDRWPTSKGIDIDVDVDALELPDAWCDPVRTTEVLNNLLDNAVKFTPTGGSVAVSATRDDARDLRVAVQDTGRGVQPENRERVFEQYFREAGDGDSGRGGLGLGLFVCRELVDRQGGRIWLESRPLGAWRVLRVHAADDRCPRSEGAAR